MKLSGVYIIGGGGFSKQVVDSFIHNKIQINGIFDDKYNTNLFYYKYPIVGKITDIKKYNKNINLFCGIGDNQVRKRIVQEYNKSKDKKKIKKSIEKAKGEPISL